jgi:hypothetical protein
MDKWFPVLEAIKGVLFGESVNVQSRAQWREAVFMASELFQSYLIYTYQLEKHPLISKQGLKAGDEILIKNPDIIFTSLEFKGKLYTYQTVKVTEITNILVNGLP